MATRWRPKQTTGLTVAGDSTRRNLVSRDDNPVRCTAAAGGSDPTMAVTVDRRHQVGSYGQRSEACSQSLLTGDTENLKKIKEARNRQPEAGQHSFPSRTKSFREVLNRDSGNSRLGAYSVSSEAIPKHTRHAISSSGKSTCQSERRSSEILDPRLSAFHPFSHKSRNTSPRRTELEKSGSAQCRNKNRTVILKNKTPAKYSSTSTKHLLAQEVESKEIQFVRKMSDPQVMHKLLSSGQIDNRKICERKTLADGLSINEQDGSPLPNKKKVRAIPQQSVSFSRTCIQTPHLSKDSRTEQLLPHDSSKVCSRTMTSRAQTSVKNKDDFCRDLKVLAPTKSMTPDVRRKTTIKKECLALISSKGTHCSASGGQTSDNKESTQNVPEFAKQYGIDGNESSQTFQHFSRDRNTNKITQNVPELYKDQDMNELYYDTNSSLEKQASSSDVQISVNTGSTTIASDTNINVLSPVEEESCLANRKLVSEPTSHSAEFLDDNSDGRFLQLAFQNKNANVTNKELENCNFGSKKHCQKVEIYKNIASIMFYGNLCDNNKGENRDQELICDTGRVSNVRHAQESNISQTENSCQGLNSNRGKSLCQKSEMDVAKVDIIYPDMGIDNSKVQNVYPQLEIDNSKVQNVCPQLEIDNSKVQNVCPQLEIDNSKVQNVGTQQENDDSNVQNVHPQLENDDSNVQNVHPQLENDDRNVQNVYPQLEDDNNKVQNVYPQLKNDNSNVQNVHPQLKNDNSNVQNVHPQLEIDDSNVQNVHPQLENDDSNVQNVHPQLENDNSNVQNVHPQLEDDNNKVQNVHPQLEDDNNKVQNEYPQLENDDSNVQNVHPQLENDDSNVQNVHPQLEIDDSNVQNVHPQLENDDSNVQNVHPQLENDNSNVQNVHPQLEDDNNKVQNVHPQLEDDNNKVQNEYPQLENDDSNVQNVHPQLENDNSNVQHLCTELQNDNSKVQNICLEVEADESFQTVDSKSQNSISKLQNVCQELDDDNIKFQNVCQILESDKTEFQNSNIKFQNLCLELEAESNVGNLCQENDPTWQIQGLWQQLKSKKDQSNQPGVDISMWKRTGLLNKILDKAELNLESLALLFPQIDEDCTGTMSPLDFRGLNFARDIGIAQCTEDDDVYDEKLEKALKESEQLLDELRLLTGSGVDLLAGGLEKVEEAVPGVHRSVAGCKKNLKMFMA